MNWQPNCLVQMSMQELFSDVPEQVKEFAREAIRNGWKFFVVDQRRGRCYYDKGTITIPLWVIQSKKIGQKTWYISHEIAHIHAPRDGHGQMFMRALKRICPKEFQHYELEYKPRAAIAAGISYPLDQL
jgi:hypothetical protein